MGSSAQNSSGVHWCRRRVRFNRVPEKVEKVWEQGSGEGWEGQVGSFGAEPGQVQQGSGEGSGEGLGGGSEEGCGEDSGRLCGAEPGQVQ